VRVWLPLNRISHAGVLVEAAPVEILTERQHERDFISSEQVGDVDLLPIRVQNDHCGRETDNGAICTNLVGCIRVIRARVGSGYYIVIIGC
jgi:hypothetical protein